MSFFFDFTDTFSTLLSDGPDANMPLSHLLGHLSIDTGITTSALPKATPIAPIPHATKAPHYTKGHGDHYTKGHGDLYTKGHGDLTPAGLSNNAATYARRGSHSSSVSSSCDEPLALFASNGPWGSYTPSAALSHSPSIAFASSHNSASHTSPHNLSHGSTFAFANGPATSAASTTSAAFPHSFAQMHPNSHPHANLQGQTQTQTQPQTQTQTQTQSYSTSSSSCLSATASFSSSVLSDLDADLPTLPSFLEFAPSFAPSSADGNNPFLSSSPSQDSLLSGSFYSAASSVSSTTLHPLHQNHTYRHNLSYADQYQTNSASSAQSLLHSIALGSQLPAFSASATSTSVSSSVSASSSMMGSFPSNTTPIPTPTSSPSPQLSTLHHTSFYPSKHGTSASSSSSSSAPLGPSVLSPSVHGNRRSSASNISPPSAQSNAHNNAQDPHQVDPCNVFVKYLPADMSDDGLAELFQPFGDIISAKVMVDVKTGQSLGYGFIRYTTADEAYLAIAKMSGAQVGNKTLLCKLSNSSANQAASLSSNLYIKPLLPSTSEDDLYQLFAPFGRIIECKVMVDIHTGKSKQVGFVRFERNHEAVNALKTMNGRFLNPNYPPLSVKFAETDNQRASRKARRQTQPTSSTPNSVGSSQGTFGSMGDYYGVNSYFADGSLGSAYDLPEESASNLFVFHLPSHIDDDALRALFSPFGGIDSIKVIADLQTGESRGYGFVKFVNMEDAARCVSVMNGFQIGNKRLKVSFKTPKNLRSLVM